MKRNTLVIEYQGSAKLGNCYYQYVHIVKSLNRPLTEKVLAGLRELGYFGSGQEFTTKELPAEEVEFGNRYFVAEVVTRVDSSD